MNRQNRLPKALRRKLDHYLSMDYQELLNEYVDILHRGGVPLEDIAKAGPPPNIEVIYRVLIPELFDYAAAWKAREAEAIRQSMH